MKSLLLISCAIVIAASFAAALAPAPNLNPEYGTVSQVKELPGLAPGSITAPAYSGFAKTKVPRIHQHPDTPSDKVQSMYMHYLIAGPANASLVKDIVLFASGGPGAPSLWSAMTEGTWSWVLNEQSYTTDAYKTSGIPSPIYNEHAWSEHAIVVWMDAPPPTGLSYCGCDGEHNASDCGQSGNWDSCGTWNDTRAGVAYAEALRVLVEHHFPDLLANNRNLHTFQESYGGVYSSSMLEVLFTDSKYSAITSALTTTNYGDACLGSDRICGNKDEEAPWWRLSFMVGRGQLSSQLWDQTMAACGGESGLKSTAPLSAACKSAIQTAETAIGEYFTYFLFDECPHNEFLLPQQQKRQPTPDLLLINPPRPHQQRRRKAKHAHIFAQMQQSSSSSSSTAVGEHSHPAYLSGYWCPGWVFTDYMRTSAAKLAFGAAADANFLIADNANGMTYSFNMRDGMQILAALLRNDTKYNDKKMNAHRSSLRIRAYQADSDAAVLPNFVENVWYNFFQQEMKFDIEKQWQNWFLSDFKIAGGYNVIFGGGAAGSGAFTTVRGSGHMVPEFRPRAASWLFRKILNGEI